MRSTLAPGIHRAPWSTVDGRDVLIAIGDPHPLTGKPTILASEPVRAGQDADVLATLRLILRAAKGGGEA
jgi:hypothetical protein